MKKLLTLSLTIMALFGVCLMSGCGDEPKKEEPKPVVTEEKSENFQEAADKALHETLEDNEIVSVNYKGDTLTIKLSTEELQKENKQNLPIEVIEVTRVSAVGDKIVDIPNFDNKVKTVVVEFTDGKSITMPTDIIKKNEYGMRYFPSEYIDKNLK